MLVKFTEDTMFGDVANISEDKYINDLERKKISLETNMSHEK